MKQLGSWLALTALVSLLTGRASAQVASDVPTRAMQVSWAAGVPSLGFSAKDFADAKVQKKLQSGLPQTVVIRLYAYPDHGHEPLAVTALSCRVVYDLWEGVYRIERQTEQSDKTLSAKSLDGVVQQCLQGQDVRLGDAALFAKERGHAIYFAALLELNPLSQDTVQRIRRWLARPGGNQLEGNAFFGSFVSIFVTRNLGAAEKTLAFRTAPLPVPP